MKNSRSALPDGRHALFYRALHERRSELRRSWDHLISADGLKTLGPIAGQVEFLLSHEDSVGNRDLPANFTWLTCADDFWSGLQAVALAGKIDCRPADVTQKPLTREDLRRLTSAERFQVLCDRYRFPLNIGAPSEIDVAEELLRQLMVVDRGKAENGTAFDTESVLLGLNLTGVRALVTHDLRSFDALNCFYELPRPVLIQLRANCRLFASWLCLYAQLLSKTNWLRCA